MITSSMEVISNPIKLLPFINYHNSVHLLLALLFSCHGCWWRPHKMPTRNPDLSHRPSGSSQIMKLRKQNSRVPLKLRRCALLEQSWNFNLYHDNTNHRWYISELFSVAAATDIKGKRRWNYMRHSVSFFGLRQFKASTATSEFCYSGLRRSIIVCRGG